jgi:MOSC domain-containing protein YiiM
VADFDTTPDSTESPHSTESDVGTGGLVPASHYTAEDLVNTVRVFSSWWFFLVENLKDAANDELLAPLLSEQQAVLNRLATEADLPTELLQLSLDDEHEFSLAASVLRKRLDDDRVAALRRCVDASMQLLLAGGERVRALRPTASPTAGAVQGLFQSAGGVPKLAVDTVAIGPRGVIGDVQKTRQHHGRPWQALCLWSVEVIERLQHEGHPINPGNAGENVSIQGLDWRSVLPGTRLSIGPVVAEVSLYALPCAKNAQWFADRNFERVHHQAELGISRLYASVLQGGSVRIGDPVSVW